MSDLAEKQYGDALDYEPSGTHEDAYVDGWNAALRAIEAEAFPGLDVDRLAEAVLAARSTTRGWKGSARATEPTTWDKVMAKRIIVAYQPPEADR